MNVLKAEKQLAVVAALVEGVSIRSIERLTGVHRDTIMRLTVRVGTHCQQLLADRMTGLRCERVQVDEIWTYCQKKQARLTFEERHAPHLGDQYMFVGIDARRGEPRTEPLCPAHPGGADPNHGPRGAQPGPHFDELHRAPEPHGAHGVPAVH
jgi:hypothetical protein